MSKLSEQPVHRLNLYRKNKVMGRAGWGMAFYSEEDISGDYAVISTGKTYHLHQLDRGIDLFLPKETALRALNGERIKV